ncbi:MAG TPA: rhomboid family intramembrane serine protease [Thermoplasmata archaeon]|nr:rhomboid family intramembrane serine protease [Thermoplasmata archaeon]
MNPFTWAALAAIGGAIVFSAWRRALLSLALAIAIVLVYLLLYASAYFPDLGVPAFVELAWLHYPGLYESPPWTVLTTIFVHAGPTHLILNLLGFILITPLLEERIGGLRWGLVFFLGALAGEFLFWVIHAGEPFTLVGASGGLMAILGAFARLYPRERVTLFLPFPGMPSVPVIWIAIGFLLLSFAMAGSSFGGIAYEAHLGGLGFGLAAAPLVMRVPRVGSRVRGVAIDAAALEPLATTRELRRIWDELRAADVPEVRAAWLERFVAKARCPKCGGDVRIRRRRLTSRCGWRLPG